MIFTYKTLRVSSHYWNNHKHNHNHKQFGQFRAKNAWDIIDDLWWSQSIISQTYCDIPKQIVKSHKPIVNFKNRLEIHKQIKTIAQCSLRLGEKPLECGNLPSQSIVYWISDSRINCLFICQNLSKFQQLILKLQLDVHWIKTMLNQKKQCSAQLSLANRNCSFLKIDQLN